MLASLKSAITTYSALEKYAPKRGNHSILLFSFWDKKNHITKPETVWRTFTGKIMLVLMQAR